MLLLQINARDEEEQEGAPVEEQLRHQHTS